jgi:hypothetical protein
VTTSQNKPSGNFQYRKDQQQVSKHKELPPRIFYHYRQLGHYANECPHPKQQKPQQQNQNPGAAKGNHGKNLIFQVKQGQLNFMGNNSIREPLPTATFTFESRDEILFKGCKL